MRGWMKPNLPLGRACLISSLTPSLPFTKGSKHKPCPKNVSLSPSLPPVPKPDLRDRMERTPEHRFQCQTEITPHPGPPHERCLSRAGRRRRRRTTPTTPFFSFRMGGRG